MRNFCLLIIFLVIGTHTLFAQTTVKGKVTDFATGESLPGVSVSIKGTSTGTVSKFDGTYSLTLASDRATLVFSYVGYITVEFRADGSTQTLNVQLKEEVSDLEEVVVTGLASSIKRSNLANAVSTISAKELTGTTTPQTLDGALYGKLTGVNIVANSGAPGGGISVKLRGTTTIFGKSEPLYIVDGVYIDNSANSAGTNPVSGASSGGAVSTDQDNAANRIADINPDDIENIEILKGASAAAIYGSRANAGVVIITTKKGRAGKTSVNIRQDIGFAVAQKLLGQRNFTEEIVLAEFGQAELDKFIKARNEGTLTDYEKEMYGNTGLLYNTSVNVSGGNDKTTYFVSASLKSEDGIIKNTGFKRHSVRANVTHKISKIFDIGISTNYINSSADRGLTNNDNNGVSYGIALAFTRPWNNLFPDENGIYPKNPSAASNPLATRDLSTINETTNRAITGATLNAHIIQKSDIGLRFVFNSGVDYYNNETTVYFPEFLQFMEGGLNGFYSRGNNVSLSTNLTGSLVLDKQINKSYFTSQIGISRLDFRLRRLTTQATQLIGGQQNLEQAGAVGVFNRNLRSSDIGYFFQQEFNYDDKIIATAGIRLDQSTLNGDPNKLFAYPKASLAVNVANFDFWKAEAVNQLKLRVAYGEAGGVPAADQVTLQQPAFTVFNGQNIDGKAGSVITLTRGNADIKPERSREIEAGFDMGFLENRLSLEATYYLKTVEDLLIKANVASSSGYSFRNINGGALRNQGVELAFNAEAVKSDNFRWNSRTSFWMNRAIITQLDIPAYSDGGFSDGLGNFRIEEGVAPTQIIGFNSETGELENVGNAEPDFQMSFYNTFTIYKNLEISFLFHWKKGGENINLTSLLSDIGGTSFDYDDDDDGDGVINGEQRLNGDAREFVESSSYFRLREIGLYYTLPARWFKDIAKVKVGISGNNLFTVSPYKSYDPEVSNFGNNGISTGVEVTPFPSSKRVMFHLALGF